MQLRFLKKKMSFNNIFFRDNKIYNMKSDKINIINVDYNFKKPFEKISSKSNQYILECFKKGLLIAKTFKISGLINGPISKKTFLKNKFRGITEFLSSKFKIKDKFAMLIFNKKISVCPITTHLPVSKISKEISKKKIISKSILINNFFKRYFNKKAKYRCLWPESSL